MSRLLLLFALFSSSVFAVDYRFTPPEFPPDRSGLQFHYYLPLQDKFASNVSLVSQEYVGSLEVYDQITRAQFEHFSFEVLRAEIRNGEIVYEYRGELKGRQMHWYQRVLKRGDTIYLVTATFPQSRADTDGTLLRASVDSFRLQ